MRILSANAANGFPMRSYESDKGFRRHHSWKSQEQDWEETVLNVPDLISCQSDAKEGWCEECQGRVQIWTYLPESENFSCGDERTYRLSPVSYSDLVNSAGQRGTQGLIVPTGKGLGGQIFLMRGITKRHALFFGTVSPCCARSHGGSGSPVGTRRYRRRGVSSNDGLQRWSLRILVFIPFPLDSTAGKCGLHTVVKPRADKYRRSVGRVFSEVVVLP